jgi:peptide/nickel transport system ATP-binding protein
MEELLKIRNLTTEFTSDGIKTTAVKGISFSLNKGETVGIVGESGSGKSVTSLSVMQLIASPPGKISSGEIIYKTRNGEDINLLSLSEKEMRKYRGNEIAMIFQEPMTSLNPVFTCGSQVMEALQLHKDLDKKSAKAKTIEIFNKVKLPRPEIIFDSYPHQISGGQKQRVMIAMAMSCDPAILIADEPTTALDVTVQATILSLMGDLQKENNMGIIFITHDLGVIAELAQRVIVMYKGNIVEEGPIHPRIACMPPTP